MESSCPQRNAGEAEGLSPESGWGFGGSTGEGSLAGGGVGAVGVVDGGTVGGDAGVSSGWGVALIVGFSPQLEDRKAETNSDSIARMT
jgi:hypothetical protein